MKERGNQYEHLSLVWVDSAGYFGRPPRCQSSFGYTHPGSQYSGPEQGVLVSLKIWTIKLFQLHIMSIKSFNSKGATTKLQIRAFRVWLELKAPSFNHINQGIDIQGFDKLFLCRKNACGILNLPTSFAQTTHVGCDWHILWHSFQYLHISVLIYRLFNWDHDTDDT